MVPGMEGMDPYAEYGIYLISMNVCIYEDKVYTLFSIWIHSYHHWYHLEIKSFYPSTLLVVYEVEGEG